MDFVVKTDQPQADGGDGSAVSPFELFFCSIAACAGFYALEFCQARNISTEGMRIDMEAEKAEGEKLYGKISIILKLPAGFPEKYKGAIVKAMDTCTVKKHLQNPPQFVLSVE